MLLFMINAGVKMISTKHRLAEYRLAEYRLAEYSDNGATGFNMY
jgi:hypothetical protein